jgi:phage terminase Nu1 subunit (DNA packaging protein)
MTNVHIVAKALNLTVTRVQQLANEPGCPAKLGRGEYDLARFVVWYLRFLQSELDRRGSGCGPEAPEMHAARLRLISAQVDRIEMENAFANGDVVEVAAVRDEMIRRVMNCRQRLRAIPTRLGLELLHKGEAYCKNRLAAAIDEALHELDGDFA